MESLATDLGTLITSSGTAIAGLCAIWPLNLFVACGIAHLVLGLVGHGKSMFKK